MKPREKLARILKERVLLLDGAYGTEFMKVLDLGDMPPEVLNVEKPDIVEKLQKSYVKAGSDVLLTNTFGATPAKLAKLGLDGKFEDIVRQGVRIAKKASEGKAFIFGDVGPTGELPYPLGDKDFEFFYRNFKRHIEILVEEGVDGIILETFSDIMELKAAVFAARDVSQDVFLVAHLTFDENGRSLTGTDPLNFAAVMEDIDVDAIGINCTLGPEELLPIFQELSKYTSKFLTAEPNAGMPIVENGKTVVYSATPDEFAVHIDSYWESGVNIIGGCCGTSPKHIRKMRLQLGKRPPVKRSPKKIFLLSSPSHVVTLDRFVIIGERINPAGRKKLRKAMEKQEIEFVLKDGRKQKEAGANILDVNFGVEQLVSDEFMEKVVLSLSYNVAPLSLDVQTPEKLEKILKAYPGRPLVNSVRATDEDRGKMRLIRKYGGAVVLLSMEKDIPGSLEDRIKAFERGIEILQEEGIDPSRVVVDPLVLALGAGGNPKDTLGMISYLDKKGFKTIIGLSNVSFGMPDRSFLNASFLVMAVKSGLTSAIMNPLDDVVMKSLKSSLLLLKKEEIEKTQIGEENEIVKYLLSGNADEVLNLTEKMLKEMNTISVVERFLRPAMERIGDMYNKGEIFLPQLILASQAAKPTFELIEKKMEKSLIGKKGKVIIATVKGDIHDIGKNIVAAVLKSAGFEVIDLGKDVPSDAVVNAVKKEKPLLLALSAMMTTAASRIAEIIRLLRENGIDVPVLVGGASLNEKLAKELGADFYAKNAIQAVKILKDLEGER